MLREAVVVLRALLHQPTLVLAAVGTLALGIAAPTALFTTVNAALLRPLRFPAPHDIYAVTARITDGRYTSALTATAEPAGLQESSGRVLHGTGYEVGAGDPAVIGFTVVTILVAALAATLLPARRAAAVDPSLALRSG
jgi:ABC-type antimicrobial peptide transport system permease subunit